MYQDRNRSPGRIILLAAVLLVVVLLGAYRLRQSVPQEMEEDSILAIRNAVRESALQCYVVEGVYPPDIQYLQDNYGLRINTEAYIVAYEAYAENQMPYIKVVKRNR